MWPHLVWTVRLFPIRQGRQSFERRLYRLHFLQITTCLGRMQEEGFYLLNLELTSILLGIDTLIKKLHIRSIALVVHTSGDEVIKLLRHDEFTQKWLEFRR